MVLFPKGLSYYSTNCQQEGSCYTNSLLSLSLSFHSLPFYPAWWLMTKACQMRSFTHRKNRCPIIHYNSHSYSIHLLHYILIHLPWLANSLPVYSTHTFTLQNVTACVAKTPGYIWSLGYLCVYNTRLFVTQIFPSCLSAVRPCVCACVCEMCRQNHRQAHLPYYPHVLTVTLLIYKLKSLRLFQLITLRDCDQGITPSLTWISHPRISQVKFVRKRPSERIKSFG